YHLLEQYHSRVAGDQTMMSVGGISDERPICRESQAPTTKVLLFSAAPPVRIRPRPRVVAIALAAIALALAMFEWTFGHQKLSSGRGQTAATTSRTAVSACTAVRRSPPAQRSGEPLTTRSRLERSLSRHQGQGRDLEALSAEALSWSRWNSCDRGRREVDC